MGTHRGKTWWTKMRKCNISALGGVRERLRADMSILHDRGPMLYTLSLGLTFDGCLGLANLAVDEFFFLDGQRLH